MMATKKSKPTTAPSPIAAARLSHATENTADYLETVSDLIKEKGEARLVEIAARLGVSNATANKTLQRIQREGHIHAEPYRSVFLTASGERLAEQARRCHHVVLEFLRAGGVPEAAAQRDAEGIEHHVGEETMALLARLTEHMRKDVQGRNAIDKEASAD